MKSFTKCTLAIGVLLSLTATVKADDWRALSPKARDNQPKYSTTPDNSPNSIEHDTYRFGTPKAASARLTYAPEGSSKNDPDLIREQREVVYTGRSPFLEMKHHHLREHVLVIK